MSSLHNNDEWDKESGKDALNETLAEIRSTQKVAARVKERFRELQREVEVRQHEFGRIETALEGAARNLEPLLRIREVEGRDDLAEVRGLCVQLRRFSDKDIERLEAAGAFVTRVETLPASGYGILQRSVSVYESNAEMHGFPVSPPSLGEGLDPYRFDQPSIEKELQVLLGKMSPDLEERYLGAKEHFQSPHRTALEAAASDMRTVIWEIYRRLAPEEAVRSAPGYQDLGDKPGVPTHRQCVAYILTGTTDTNDPEVALLFCSLRDAVATFSGSAKALKKISNCRLQMMLAECERALVALLKKKR